MLALMGKTTRVDPAVNAVRVRNLERLLKRYGTRLEAAVAIGVHPSYLSNMLREDTGSPNWRPITEQMAQRIERAHGLPEGSLSVDQDRGRAPSGEGGSGRALGLSDIEPALDALQETDAAQMAAIERLLASDASIALVIGALLEALVRRDPELAPVLRDAASALSGADFSEVPDSVSERAQLLLRAAELPPEPAGARVAAIGGALQRLVETRR